MTFECITLWNARVFLRLLLPVLGMVVLCLPSCAADRIRVAVIAAPHMQSSVLGERSIGNAQEDELYRNFRLLLAAGLSRKFAEQPEVSVIPLSEISRCENEWGIVSDRNKDALFVEKGLCDVSVVFRMVLLGNEFSGIKKLRDFESVNVLRPNLIVSCDIVYWDAFKGKLIYANVFQECKAEARETFESQSFSLRRGNDTDRIFRNELPYFVSQIIDKAGGVLEANICSLPVRRGSNIIAKANASQPHQVSAVSVKPSDNDATEIKPSTNTIRDKWALVVGVSKFQDKRIPQLRYSAKDARDFRDFLVKEANFAPDHVRLLLDEKATERRVMSELGNKFLARVAKPDDLIVLFFSTHGSSAKADVRGKNYIVAYDSDRDDLYTTGIEMQKIVESINDRVISGRTLLVLDACHSGATTNGAKAMGDGGNFDAQELAQGSGKLVICSSQPDQISWESTRYQNGIFTRKLLEGFRSHGKSTKLGDAFNILQSAVRSEAQEDHAAKQEPVLKSKWDGNDLLICAPPSAPQALPAAVKQILEPDSSSALPPPRPPTNPQKRPLKPPVRK